MRLRPRRTPSLTAATAVAALVAVTPAHAGQVVLDRGDDLYVMNEDGSGQRLLLDSDQLPNMREIVDPSVGPTSNRVVFSAVRSDGDQFACGSNCIGVYLLDNGALRRLSDPPGATGGNVATYANDPELSIDGALTFFSNATTILSPSSLKGDLAAYQNSDGASGTADTTCADARDPAPRPDATNELVFACDDNKTLFRTGSSLGSPGDEMPLTADDQTPRDPSFSADGNTIVDAESGGDAGLWKFAYDVSAITWVLASPPGTTFSSPRFVGSRIFFVAAGNVWSVSTTCLGCSFPADASQITTSGDVGSIGWTASADPVKAIPGASTNTSTNTTTTTNTNTTTTTNQTLLAPGVTGFSFRSTAKRLRAALKAGIKVRAGCTRACTLAGKVYIDARTARRYRLGRKRIAVGKGSKINVTSPTTLTLKFTAKAKKRLAKAKKVKFSVVLTATADGMASNKAGSLTLKR